MTTFNELCGINVNEHTEKKGKLTYLSWAWAWRIFKQKCPDTTYQVIKTMGGLPYFESEAGVMVYTEVTANGITHEMWLPVMDGANKAMKRTAYTYQTKFGEKTCDAFDMFDVNKTIMRCLVKNLAMFGLAIYIYAGEDLPEAPPINMQELAELIEKIRQSDSMAALKINFEDAVVFCNNDTVSLKEVHTAAKIIHLKYKEKPKASMEAAV